MIIVTVTYTVGGNEQEWEHEFELGDENTPAKDLEALAEEEVTQILEEDEQLDQIIAVSLSFEDSTG